MVDTIQKLAAVPAKGAIFTSPETLAKAEAKVAKQTKKADNTVVLKTASYKVKPAADVAAGFPKKKPRNDDHMLDKKPAVPAKVGGPREQLAVLLKKPPTKELANQIVAIKKKAKKSWDALGVTPTEVSVILELAGK